jgi:DNA ligase-1
MSRFGSGRDSDATKQVPRSMLFFDVLHVDGDDLVDRPARERLAILDALVPEPNRVPRIEAETGRAAERFLSDAIERGHEGVMVKALDAPYEAGRRGGGWRNGGTADAPGSSRISTWAHAIQRRVASSCSARPSRA